VSDLSPSERRERFHAALSKPGAIQKLFDHLDHEAAFLPYWPEMLDYELPENMHAEAVEIAEYRAALGGRT
jgi:hypothetical protein